MSGILGMLLSNSWVQGLIMGPLIGWVGAQLIRGLNAGVAWLRAHMAGTKASAFDATAAALQNVVTQLVQAAEQTAVATAKANGTWNAETAAKVAADVLAQAKTLAAPLLMQLGKQGLTDVEAFIKSLLEAAVLSKTGTPGIASKDSRATLLASPTEELPVTVSITTKTEPEPVING